MSGGAPSTADRRRKPIAGYPTQVAACAALAERGLQPEEIGRKIGRDANHVRATLRRLSHGEKPRCLSLPHRLVADLADEAAARGTSVAELATDLLDTIIRDDLFEALLGEPALRQAQDERDGSDV